jgi:hypothetical protein
MTVPHGNDVARFATLGPDHHHQPAVVVAGGDETRLAIIEPTVDYCRGSASEYLAGSREIQTAMPERQRALCRIEGDVHKLIVPPINVNRGEWETVNCQRRAMVSPYATGFLKGLSAVPSYCGIYKRLKES